MAIRFKMSHLYNSLAYQQFLHQNHVSFKKFLEGKLDRATDEVSQDLHSLDGHEEVILDDSNIAVYHQGEYISLTNSLLGLDSLADILTEDNIRNNFTPEELQSLAEFLPDKNPALFSNVFTARGLNGKTPIQNFDRQLKKGYYSASREKEDEINQELSRQKLKEIYRELYMTLHEAEERKRMPAKKLQNFAYREEDSEVESIEDLEERGEASENSEATETEEENHGDVYEDYPNEILYRYDYTKLKVQEELLAIGEDRGERKMMALKNIVTVKPRNSEWVDNFRRQQAQRYANPTKPWVYSCQDGRKVTVAPVAKKLSVLTGKPRYHAMLKNERPACVTILTLARDAAARLPNGVGTRADICELVKQSQYITEDLPEEKLSSTISGALDRLHYMSDACVKYDSEKKLWMYLHMERNHDHPGWGDDGDEYTEKNSTKKKKSFY